MCKKHLLELVVLNNREGLTRLNKPATYSLFASEPGAWHWLSSPSIELCIVSTTDAYRIALDTCNVIVFGDAVAL
jgi:hypothetical protein